MKPNCSSADEETPRDEERKSPFDESDTDAQVDGRKRLKDRLKDKLRKLRREDPNVYPLW